MNFDVGAVDSADHWEAWMRASDFRFRGPTCKTKPAFRWRVMFVAIGKGVPFVDQVLQFLQGRKTYLSAAATILTAVGTMAGAVSPVTGASIGAICLALALMAQRFATATTQEQIVSAVLDGVAEIHGAAPATIPITPKPSQPTDVNLFDPNRQ